jgi:hypothetical protein
VATRITSADGAFTAELDSDEDSAGCHGVGGYHRVRTTVRVFDRAGKLVLEETRAHVHVTSENHDDEISGTIIVGVRFAVDAPAVILSFDTGEDLVRELGDPA